MKKFIALLALVASVSHGAVMQSYKNLKADTYSVNGSGRIAAVDVFTTVPNGTVSISRIFSTPHYTNAVDTTSEIVTNVVSTPVFDAVYYRGDGVLFTNITSRGYGDNPATTCWESTVEGETAAIWWNDVSGWHYSTTIDDRFDSYDWGINNRMVWKDADYIEFGTGADRVAFSLDKVLNRTEISTNVVTVVTTNSVTPVKAYDLVVTNTVVSGTCDGKSYHAAPAADVWLFPDDKINFSGTAVGGELRIVIE